MDRVHLARDSSTAHVQAVAVGVYQDTKHIGLLTRDPGDGVVRLIHLAFHEDLRIEDDASNCFLWVEPLLEWEQARLVAAQARRVYRRYVAGNVPYGFSPYVGYFDAHGEIRWTSPGSGLTCATFVLAVFDSAGVRLLKGETWPVGRDEDKAFQNQIVSLIRSRPSAPLSHVEGMSQDIGTVRFRVLEVAGAVAAEVYPVDFTTASMLGEKLKAIMQEAATRPHP